MVKGGLIEEVVFASQGLNEKTAMQCLFTCPRKVNTKCMFPEEKMFTEQKEGQCERSM